jgi:hypothetical protein
VREDLFSESPQRHLDSLDPLRRRPREHAVHGEGADGDEEGQVG